MGVYRLLLASLVVLFHFGGLSWIVGRVAVFGFYCTSGFLIFQVFDRVYVDAPRGTWRFYGNRLLRLGPLYVVHVIATLVMVRTSGPVGPLDPASGTPLLENMGLDDRTLLLNALTFAPHAFVADSMPVLEFAPHLIPQGWSIGVELTCYLLAPLAVLTTRRQPARLWIWIAPGMALFVWGVWTSGLDYDRFQSIVYKNAFTSLVVFLAGGAFYYLRRSRGQPVRFHLVVVLLAVWVAVVTVGAFRLGEGPSARVFTEYVWLTVALTGVVAASRVTRFGRLDTALGNLCYGVYLNHFLIAGMLVMLGASRYFDQPGTLRFGFVVLAGSIALACLTYYGVERPFDRVRRFIRGGPAPDSEPSLDATGRPVVAIAVVAAALVLLVKPAGFVAARASQAGAGALASSPEFDLRWRAGVSDAERERIERNLGLVNLGHVERDPRRRTWTYRLQSPTYRGLRATLAHESVEDSSIDSAQLEMLRQ